MAARIPLNDGVYGLAFGAGAIWVSAFDSQYLYRIDPATNRVSALHRGRMEQAEVTATSTAVWVAVFGQGDVVKVDPAANAIVARIHVGGQPEEVTLAAGAAWVPNENRTVARIDPATNAVVARIRVGAGPRLRGLLQGPALGNEPARARGSR